MKSTTYIACFFITLLLWSCKDSNVPFETHNVDGAFSIAIPDYMVELDLGHQFAQFQFGNEMKEHYVIGQMETEADFNNVDLEMDLAFYADFTIDILRNTLKDVKVEDKGIKTHNGMEAKEVVIYGIFSEHDLKIYYNIMFYQSAKAMYTVTTWTLADREERYKENMNKIIHSLKEL